MIKIALLLLSFPFFHECSAQLFEVLTTKYSGEKIVHDLYNKKLNSLITIRDSVIHNYPVSNYNPIPNLEVIETYFDNEKMGLIKYKNGLPYDLLGFWDINGKQLTCGVLKKGNGVIINSLPAEYKSSKFSEEKVRYKNGQKNGECAYWCRCSACYAIGRFKNDSKKGTWKHYNIYGACIDNKKKRFSIKKILKKINPIKPKSRGHCMAMM